MPSAEAPRTSILRLAALYGSVVAMIAVVGCVVPWLGNLLIFFTPSCGFGLFILWSFVLIAQLASRRTPSEANNISIVVAHLIGASAITIVPAVTIVLLLAR